MTRENVLIDKCVNFAVRTVNCYRYLANTQKEFVMSKQMYRSGTSIGANLHEGLQAQSRPDFVSKLSIALKEANETSYWLVILRRTNYLSEVQYVSLKTDLDEIIRILIASIKTTKKNMQYE